MGLAIRVLWVALQRANRREIEAAHKSADRTNAYASQLHVLSTATKAVARQLRALRDRIGDEVAAVGADISKILKHLGID